MKEYDITHRDDEISYGFVNLGQTCWFGILMQLFYHTDPAGEILKMGHEDINKLNPGNQQLAEAFKLFLENMANGSGEPVHPEQLLQKIQEKYKGTWRGDIFQNEALDWIK